MSATEFWSTTKNTPYKVEAMRTRTIAKGKFCSMCGGQQYQSPSGDVCKKGHGGAGPIDAPEKKKSSMASKAKDRAKRRTATKHYRKMMGNYNFSPSVFKSKKYEIIVFYDRPDDWEYKGIICHYLGDFGYHNCFNDPGFSIVHLPSGMMLGRTETEKSAKFVVRQLKRMSQIKWYPSRDSEENKKFIDWYMHTFHIFSEIMSHVSSEKFDDKPNPYSEEAERLAQKIDDIPF